MDYNALIQNRKSARQFTDKKVPEAGCNELEAYYKNACQRLAPGIDTELTRPSASYPNSTDGSPVSSTRVTYPAAFRVKSARPLSGSTIDDGRSFSSRAMREMFRGSAMPAP